MEYVRLGRTALKVSRLCLGTMNFGPTTTESDSFKIMDRALELGINFFDTADVYGWKKGEGLTERIIGRWLDQGGGRRDKVVLATKLYNSMGDGPNDRGLSSVHIRQACDASLKRLRTDHIDLYQMHHVDREAPWEEVWQAFEVLVQQGKILYAGSSNFGGWHIAQAQENAKARGYMGLVSEQCVYHLDKRQAEMEVTPACEHYGLGVIPWSPLGGGLLGGILKKAKEGRRTATWMLDHVKRNKKRFQDWEAFCRRRGDEPAEVALAWLLTRKAVTAPIIGPRTLGQLEGAVKALKVRLSAKDLAKIDSIFPGHKTAPEHFAW